MTEAQLDYVRDVLGVNSVILDAVPEKQPLAANVSLDEASAEIVTRGNSESKLVFVLEEALMADAEALLKKMISAMRVDFAQVFIIEGAQVSEQWDDIEAFLSGELIVVVMGDQKIGETEKRDSFHMFYTYHPSELLRDNALKKPAWAHLQNVMRFL